jgi:hypothetical protein
MSRNLVIVGLVLGALLGSLHTNEGRRAAAIQAAEEISVASACRTTWLGLDDMTSCVVEEP